ncbi:uncharacterized protein LOC131929845 [Physella acuta]|uniref:uncharacterized protein LOC131929845 n=1 Tax=Physella acuta TaxID=109671 RepID=UPI0027DC90C2|nr:uncharacterized protein LOC131929845 [Physella acuta]
MFMKLYISCLVFISVSVPSVSAVSPGRGVERCARIYKSLIQEAKSRTSRPEEVCDYLYPFYDCGLRSMANAGSLTEKVGRLKQILQEKKMNQYECNETIYTAAEAIWNFGDYSNFKEKGDVTCASLLGNYDHDTNNICNHTLTLLICTVSNFRERPSDELISEFVTNFRDNSNCSIDVNATIHRLYSHSGDSNSSVDRSLNIALLTVAMVMVVVSFF